MKAQEQIEKLKTLQESFDNLANTYDKLATTSAIGIEAELQQGKKSLVDAIEYKGGESSADKSLQGIAEDIKEIPNFDEYFKLAGVLAGDVATNALIGHNQNVDAGNIKVLRDNFGVFKTLRNNLFSHWDILEELNMPYTEKIGTTNYYLVKVLKFEILKVLPYESFAYNPNLEVVYFPSVEEIGSYSFRVSPKIRTMTFGTLKIANFVFSNMPKLKNITIGQGTDIDLPLGVWVPTSVINEGQSGIDELNNNLRTNLLEKLADHSEDGETRTLRLGWLAHVTQENIDYANSKGWTLTT